MLYINQHKDKMFFLQIDMNVNIRTVSQVELLCIKIILKLNARLERTQELNLTIYCKQIFDNNFF